VFTLYSATRLSGLRGCLALGQGIGNALVGDDDGVVGLGDGEVGIAIRAGFTLLARLPLLARFTPGRRA